MSEEGTNAMPTKSSVFPFSIVKANTFFLNDARIMNGKMAYIKGPRTILVCFFINSKAYPSPIDYLLINVKDKIFVN